MKHNFHTHTFRCMHASGADEDFVCAAIEEGFSCIGFSDHSPWPYQRHVSGMRMPASQLEDYVQSIRSLQNKYRGEIEILLGLECEYFPEYLPWLKEQIQKYRLDYLILGHHFSPSEFGGVYNGGLSTPQELQLYRNAALDAMDSGLFAYFAHPDLFMNGYQVFDEHAEAVSRDIIEKALETNTPLEFNLLGYARGKHNGRPGYPFPDFWRLAAEYGATAILGIDAHTPDAYADRALIGESERFLQNLGIPVTDNIRTFRPRTTPSA